MEFPARVQVKPLVVLPPEHGVPMEALLGKVDFYRNASDKGKFKGFIRASPMRFKEPSDGKFIFDLLTGAKANPVSRPVDSKALARKQTSFKVKFQQGGKQVEAKVTVPEPEETPPTNGSPADMVAPTQHTEIQAALLALGAELNLDVWVARNDRSKMWGGTKLGEMPRILPSIPTQFNEATNRTIELIDVLWLKGNAIVAAFEVESTTSIYSGLLRMSDLLALQPNLDIKLYLVAPDERREKVAQEIRRPTFSRFEKPLPVICGFLSFDKLRETVHGIRKLNIGSALQAAFLENVAEYFDEEGG